MKKILQVFLVLGLANFSLFATESNIWDSKCQNEQIWDLLKDFYKQNLSKTKKKDFKITDIEYDKISDTAYSCDYVLITNDGKKTSGYIKIRKENDSTIVSFLTKRYSFKE